MQTIAETMYVTPTHVDVFDIIDIKELCSQLSPGLRILVKAQNHDVIMSLVQLYDTVIGHEPSIDFTPDKIEAIELINKDVLLWIEKKLPNNNRGFNLDDPNTRKGFQVSDYLLIIRSRWQYYCRNVD